MSALGESARRARVFDPALGEAVAEAPLASVADVQAAVAAAQAAWPVWAATPPLKRARVMFRFKEILEARQLQLAECISREHGKVINDALGEVTRGLEVVELPAAFRICSRAITPKKSARH